MNLSQLIRKWMAEGSDYRQGIALYEQLGTNATLKDLFNRYHSRFYKEKLYSELYRMCVEHEQSLTITPPSITAGMKPYNELPAPLQELDRKKAGLFRELIQLRKMLKQQLQLKTSGHISMADALDVMSQRDKRGNLQPFSITYVSYNRGRGTGGQIIRYPKCFLTAVNKTGSRILKGTKHYAANQPKHWQNSTRNYRIADSDETRKFNIWLLFEFNGMEVTTSDVG